MNKKGFTLVELLVVIMIIGMIVTIATISITRLRKNVNEDELVTLRQNIIAGFETYRIKNTVYSGTNVDLKELNFSDGLNYNNKKCNYTNSTIEYFHKKNKLDNIDLIEDLTQEEKDYLKNKVLRSEEEIFCIKFYCDGTLIINDSDTSQTNEVIVSENGDIKQIKVNYCK